MRQLLSLYLTALLCACGGGSGSGSGPSPVTEPPPSVADTNVLPLVVGRGPGNNVNIPYVSVRVCVPGTSDCRTIDNVLVDTGSTGLRLVSAAMSGLVLPAQTTPGNAVILECAQFLSAVTWGPVKLGDIYLGSNKAPAVPLQVIADPAYPVVPSGCSAAGPVAAGADDIHANGILGIGAFVHDGQRYYNCAPTSTQTRCPAVLPVAQQVQNPVAALDSDNNGVVLQLPAIGATGARAVSGSLILGVGTRDNNQLGNALVVRTDSRGYFSTTYKGVTLANSFMDSGSNGLYFADTDLPDCLGRLTGFYCPASLQNLSATVRLINGSSQTINFSVANASSLLALPSFAYNNLGGTLTEVSFAWGLPFYFGRSVFTVIEGRSSVAGVGPLLAYTP